MLPLALASGEEAKKPKGQEPDNRAFVIIVVSGDVAGAGYLMASQANVYDSGVWNAAGPLVRTYLVEPGAYNVGTIHPKKSYSFQALAGKVHLLRYDNSLENKGFLTTFKSQEDFTLHGLEEAGEQRLLRDLLLRGKAAKKGVISGTGTEEDLELIFHVYRPVKRPTIPNPRPVPAKPGEDTKPNN